MVISTIRHFHQFCGSGGGALGFQLAEARVGSLDAQMECLGGVDVDEAACRDFSRLLGVQATHLDLFDAEQYAEWHGHAPPSGWHEVGPAALRRAAGGKAPDIIFTSPPCKGFSGLLNPRAAEGARYQALNRLTIRGIWLALEAWADDPPSLFLLENVPRIQQRGRDLVDRIRALLEAYGYATAETVHDCGELGGLAQHRRRFLLVARHREKVPPFLYEPPRRRVRAIGDVVGPLPLPDDKAAGPMHLLPRLTWRTWVRLALIPAGRDWRALQELAVVDGHLQDYGIAPATEWHGGVLGVRPWSDPAVTVTGESLPFNGAHAVADPRAGGWGGRGKYQVVRWGEPSPTVIGGSTTGQGAFAVADPRGTGIGQHGHCNLDRVTPWERPAGTVTGASRPASGALSVADPRMDSYGEHSGKMAVQDWERPARTVTGSDRVGSGAQCVSDPRTSDLGDYHALGVRPWDQPAETVTSQAAPGAGAFSIADPRQEAWGATREAFASGGHYGVVPWRSPSGAVVGNAKWDRGPWSVADPRLPEPEDRPTPSPLIVALDGTWHRPLTTLELAVLQGFPADLVLDGVNSQSWRERIGNAVPPPAARAIASTMATTLLLARSGECFVLGSTPVWVDPRIAVALAVDAGFRSAEATL